MPLDATGTVESTERALMNAVCETLDLVRARQWYGGPIAPPIAQLVSGIAALGEILCLTIYCQHPEWAHRDGRCAACDDDEHAFAPARSCDNPKHPIDAGCSEDVPMCLACGDSGVIAVATGRF